MSNKAPTQPQHSYVYGWWGDKCIQNTYIFTKLVKSSFFTPNDQILCYKEKSVSEMWPVNVHLLGWRLSTLDFVAGFIIRGRFFAVVFSRGVRSRTTVRVRSRPRVRGTGISPLPGTTRWVRFITARRVLTDHREWKDVNVESSDSHQEERVVGMSWKQTSSDPLLDVGLCFWCWSCCFLSIADLCTARMLGLDFQNYNHGGQCPEWVSMKWHNYENLFCSRCDKQLLVFWFYLSSINIWLIWWLHLLLVFFSVRIGLTARVWTATRVAASWLAAAAGRAGSGARTRPWCWGWSRTRFIIRVTAGQNNVVAQESWSAEKDGLASFQLLKTKTR